MYLSAFDLFRIGPGPSSSGTVGPQRAALRFVHDLAADGLFAVTTRVEAEVFGGAALAMREQSTDGAIVAGLCGELPERCDATTYAAASAKAVLEGSLLLGGRHPVSHRPERDLRYAVKSSVAFDGNAIRFIARDAGGEAVATRMYYSTGNGAILAEGDAETQQRVPYIVESSESMLQLCILRGKKIPDIALANECALRSPAEVRSGLLRVAHAMLAALQRGLSTHGTLPGGMRREAPVLADTMVTTSFTTEQRCATYAMAAAEENAAGGRVAAAPSNGAAGPVVALLQIWRDSGPIEAESGTLDFLLTAAAVGQLLRTLGVRDVGCQGEVGVASAMAAAGFVAVNKGSNAQILHAAERALESHLGLTCDPAGGRVQDPCIARNAKAATLAYTAAVNALRMPEPTQGLDRVARSAVERGRAMAGRYKTASVGQVAINVAEC
ncbi:MAG: L-serine ammonia-lyase [Betaproteobacteria bacterium]